MLRHLLVGNDRIDTSVKTRTKHEQPKNKDNDVNDSHYRHLPVCKEPSSVDVVVCNSPEDEAEEGIKCGGHDTKEVSHTWDDTEETLATDALHPCYSYSLSKHESNRPDENINGDPTTPANNAVRVSVLRVS